MNIKQTFSFFIILLMLFPSVASAPSTVEDGFTGYYEVTQTLSSGGNITVPEGADRVEVSVSGDVPEYETLIWGDISTYPQNDSLVYAYGFEGNDPLVGDMYGISPGIVELQTNESRIYINDTSIHHPTETYNNTQTFTFISRLEHHPDTVFETFIAPFGVSSVVSGIIVTNAANSFGIRDSDGTYHLTEGEGTSDDYSINTISFISSGDNIKAYKNTELIVNSSGFGGMEFERIGLGWSSGYYRLNGYVYDYILYNTNLSNAENNKFLYGFSGIQISSAPYTGATLTFPENTTEVEYIATDDEDREVTVEAWYSNDIEVDEYTSNGVWYANITLTVSNNFTNGSFEHTANIPAGLYRHIDSDTFALDTTNTNATYTIDSDTITVTTGYLSTGTTYYNMSAELETEETVMVNIMNVPISIYVLIVFVGLLSGAYAILRRDNEYYTHLISCVISALLFATSSYISFAGVSGEGWSTGTSMPIMTLYTLPSLGYLFAGIAAILVFYFLMRMYDIYQENADAGWMKQ